MAAPRGPDRLVRGHVGDSERASSQDSAVQVVGMLLCWLGQGVPGVLAGSPAGSWGRPSVGRLLGAPLPHLSRARSGNRFPTNPKATRAAGGAAHPGTRGRLHRPALGFCCRRIVETILCAIGLGFACAMVEPRSASDTRLKNRSRTADGDARPAWDQEGLQRFVRGVEDAAAGCRCCERPHRGFVSGADDGVGPVRQR